MTRRQTLDDTRLGIVLITGSVFLLAGSDALVKFSNASFSMWQLYVARSLIAIPLLLLWIGSHQGSRLASTFACNRWVLLRSAALTLMWMAFYAALPYISLSLAALAIYTTPLFIALLSAWVLDEPVGRKRWTAVLLGFVGVLVIARPGGAPVPPLGLAAGLGAGLIVAVVSFQIRDLSRTEAPIACVFWFAFYGALFAAVVLPFYATAHGLREWLLLVAIGLAGTLAQFLITSALRLGQVATVVVMDYTALIWATLYGWGIWGHVPAATMWLGAPIIVVAGLIITSREHFLNRRVSPTSAIDESATEEAETAPAAKGT